MITNYLRTLHASPNPCEPHTPVHLGTGISVAALQSLTPVVPGFPLVNLRCEREGRPSVADSYAMDAASNMHSCLYRSGYDISVPLNPKKTSRDLAETAPLDRLFFLTLKARNTHEVLPELLCARTTVHDLGDSVRSKSRPQYFAVVQQLAG